MFTPITRWAAGVPTAHAIPEMFCKAFKLAETERPAAVYLAVPEHLDTDAADYPGLKPLLRNVVRAEAPSALLRFSDELGIRVANTFHGKGVMPDDHPNSLGTIGFMRHDYVNFVFDNADVIIAVGYELQEFDPVRINPRGRPPLRRRRRGTRIRFSR